MSAHDKLAALNITLPKLTPPMAAFVPFLRVGNLLFLPGHIARIDGTAWVGRLGLGQAWTKSCDAGCS